VTQRSRLPTPQARNSRRVKKRLETFDALKIVQNVLLGIHARNNNVKIETVKMSNQKQEKINKEQSTLTIRGKSNLTASKLHGEQRKTTFNNLGKTGSNLTKAILDSHPENILNSH